MDAAIREARRQYAEAKPKVMENTSGFWNAEEKGSIRKAFLDMGVLLEKWASTLRAQAVVGQSAVAGFLEFGEKWLASSSAPTSGSGTRRASWCRSCASWRRGWPGWSPSPGWRVAGSPGCRCGWRTWSRAVSREAWLALAAAVALAVAVAVWLGGEVVSLQQLRAIMPRLAEARGREVLAHLNAAMAEAGIATPRRVAAFLAQLAHESGELRYMEELASGEAYEGRRDLGNTQPGDGRRYKGRGPIQLTGRANYRAAGAALGLDLEGNPAQAATLEVGFRVAAWFWTSRELNELADAGNFDAITRRINGGYNGKADRDAYHARARAVLGAA